MKTYLVGGAVRDALLNIPVYDHDWVVVGATSHDMLEQGFSQVGKDFPVFLHPKTKEEYALARTERKSGQGYHGFEVSFDPTVTLEDDLIRRDLTINAMAQDAEGQVVDPYGGQQDLADKVLRHVSEAFAEDPLRVLRVARFAAKLSAFGFTLAPETTALMKSMSASGELSALTPERVWQEVVKALNTQTPSVFFEVLDHVNALSILFPALDALKGVQQPEKHHPEGDAWVHTMMVLDASAALSNDVSVRFAALVHDLGKGLTPKALWPKHHGHEKAGVPLVTDLCQQYRVPKKTQIFAEKVTEYHGLIHRGLDSEGRPHLKTATFLKVLSACQAFKEMAQFESLLIACEADARGRLGFESRPYPQKDFWLELAKRANAVDNQAILATGVKGAEIGEAIVQERMRLIDAFTKQYSGVKSV